MATMKEMFSKAVKGLAKQGFKQSMVWRDGVDICRFRGSERAQVRTRASADRPAACHTDQEVCANQRGLVR